MDACATFSVSGGLVADYIKRGEMIPWSGVLVVEGIETGDNRAIAPGALTTRELPLPFMVQLENPVGGDGHDGATLSGRIDTLARDDSGGWPATGFIDPGSGDGDKAAQAMDRQMLRGVSVDLDMVQMMTVNTPAGPKDIITSARIIGATACPFQAFAEATIQLDVERMDTALAAAASFAPVGRLARVWTPIDAFETIIASSGMSIPVAPPLEWFEKMELPADTPLTVLSNGRVFGRIANFGTCHISFGHCVPVPRSRTNYAKFRCGTVLTAEGTSVRTGPIVMDTVHPDLRWRASDAQAFYADTGCAVCDVVPYEDEFGIVVVGAMRPDVPPARLRAFRASDISPDWRTIDGQPRECCALVAVNNSGFKMPQSLAAAAGMFVEPGFSAVAFDADDEVYALVASGGVHDCGCESCSSDHSAVEELTKKKKRMWDNEDNYAIVPRDRDERLAAIAARFGPPPARVFRSAAPGRRFGPR